MTPQFTVAGAISVTCGPIGRALSCQFTDVAGTGASNGDHVVVTIDDRGGTLPVVGQGDPIEVSMGYAETGMFPMFQGNVDDVILTGWPMTMVIKATGENMKSLLKQGRDFSYQNTTVGGAIGTLAQRNGLPTAISPEFMGMQLGYASQSGENDMNFALRMARKYDASFKVAGGKLNFVKNGTGMSASGVVLGSAVAQYGVNVKKYQATLRARPIYGSSSHIWNKLTNQEQQTETNPAGGGGAGAGDADALFGMGTPAATGQPEAADVSKAQGDATARAEGELAISIIGSPTVMAGALLQVVGIRADVDGDWLMTEVTHMIDNRGYDTHIKATYPGDPGGEAAIAAAASDQGTWNAAAQAASTAGENAAVAAPDIIDLQQAVPGVLP